MNYNIEKVKNLIDQVTFEEGKLLHLDHSLWYDSKGKGFIFIDKTSNIVEKEEGGYTIKFKTYTSDSELAECEGFGYYSHSTLRMTLSTFEDIKSFHQRQKEGMLFKELMILSVKADVKENDTIRIEKEYGDSMLLTKTDIAYLATFI